MQASCSCDILFHFSGSGDKNGMNVHGCNGHKPPLYLVFLLGELAVTAGGSVVTEDMNVKKGALTSSNPPKLTTMLGKHLA